MIAILAATVLLVNPVIERPDSESRIATLQAVIRVPKLGEQDRQLLNAYASCIGEETGTYSHAQIDEVVGRVGSRVRVSILPDHIRVSLSCLPPDYPTATSLMISILKESIVSKERLGRQIADTGFRKFGYWRDALWRQSTTAPKYREDDLRSLLNKVFRAENIWLAVGGNIAPGVAPSKWEGAMSDWRVPQDRSGASRTQELELSAWTNSVSALGLRGTVLKPSDADFTTKLLGVAALGTGKSASLWRVARERLGISYRQEAVLWPVEGGFEPRLIVVTSRKDDLPKLGEELRNALVQDIETWTEENRAAAVGVCSNFLTRGGDLSPLYWAVGRPINRDIEDQTFVAAYWQMKAGAEWNPFSLAGRLGFVELADVKTWAKNFVSTARLEINAGKVG